MASSSRSSLATDERDLRAELRQHTSEGQWFLAYDTAMQGMEMFPHIHGFRQEAANALINLGAIAEAEKVLLPISPQLDSDGSRFLKVAAELQSAAANLISSREEDAGETSNSRQVAAAVRFLEAAENGKKLLPMTEGRDEETLGLLGRVYKAFWRESNQAIDARRCRDTYLRAYIASGGYWSCINVATMTRAMAKPGVPNREKLLEESRVYARLAIEKCERESGRATGDAFFWLPATSGEARLLLDDESGAINDFRRARSYGQNHKHVVSIHRQLRLLADIGVSISEATLQLFAPPAVVCFSGHMIDAPGRSTPRFPAEAESSVRAAIDRALDAFGESIGYASAACGADILFLEALLEREAEVNVILPFRTEDFVRTSVGFAGERWMRRFRQVLKLAGDRVYFATTEPYLDCEELFRFGNNVMMGLCRLRARSLETSPRLLAVIDQDADAGANGTAAVVESMVAERHLIDLGAIRRSLPPTSSITRNAGFMKGETRAPTPAALAPTVPRVDANRDGENSHGMIRTIKTFLFADVTGYSKLPETQIALFMFTFLRTLADRLDKLAVQPLLVETWGDGLYVVMSNASSMVEYALAIQETVAQTNWGAMGLPADLTMRIALHAGPAFKGIHPLSKSTSFFGSHVSRAARIEPITLPGHIYATLQFVALLSAERSAYLEKSEDPQFSCVYLGRLALAKDFGQIPLFHIRRCVDDRVRDGEVETPLAEN